jgi:hypothetical protein
MRKSLYLFPEPPLRSSQFVLGTQDGTKQAVGKILKLRSVCLLIALESFILESKLLMYCEFTYIRGKKLRKYWRAIYDEHLFFFFFDNLFCEITVLLKTFLVVFEPLITMKPL